jgi:hypothetical protein
MDDILFQEFMDSMACGVTFIPRAMRLVGLTGMNPIQPIVGKFGLLEPSLATPEPGEVASDLFVMRPAQQLVALTMLGINTALLLEASAFRFEILSTHVAKCAIAASSAIELSARPHLQTILTKIGFRVDNNATSDAIKMVWEKLALYKPADCKFYGRDPSTTDTRQMKVELDLLVAENGADLLQIDKVAFRTLHKMEAVTAGESEFTVPSTWINYGASPLADGFVSFFCTDESAPINQRVAFRFTLLNQAKYYNNNSRLNPKKLNEHAIRCNDVSLDGLFGKCRFLCVAGNADVIHAKKSCDVNEILCSTLRMRVKF